MSSPARPARRPSASRCPAASPARGPARLTAGGQTRRGGGRAMFQYGIVAGDLRIEHQHADVRGRPWKHASRNLATHTTPRTTTPNASERGNVYVCTVCQETIRMSEPAAGTSGVGPAPLDAGSRAEAAHHIVEDRQPGTGARRVRSARRRRARVRGTVRPAPTGTARSRRSGSRPSPWPWRRSRRAPSGSGTASGS